MAKVQQVYRKLAIHSRTIFSNFSLFWATIFQIHVVKSATMRATTFRKFTVLYNIDITNLHLQ